VPKWQIEAKPSAVMNRVDEEPIRRADGATTQRWMTRKGVIHIQVVYPNGRIEWWRQIEA
jgi:hypothetical protein